MDPKTLVVSLVLVLGCLALLAALVARGRKVRALYAWALGMVSCSLGMVGLLVQGPHPTAASLLVSNLFLIAYNFAIAYGLRCFLGLPRPWPRRFTAYALVWGAGMLCFVLAVPSYPVRVTLTSGFMALLSFEFAATLVTSGREVPQALKMLLVGTGAGYGLFHLFRAAAVYGTQSPSVMLDIDLSSATFLVVMGTSILWAGGLVMLDTNRLQRQIRADTEELRRLNLLKDRVLAMAGHDLRGPLGNLKMIWEQLGIQLSEGRGAELDPALVTLVDRSLTGTQELLENLLSFATAPKDPEARAVLPVAVSAVLDLWEASFRNKGVALVNGGGDGPLVRADQDAVSAVLRNLVGNALKFTPAGGRVTVRIVDDGSPEVALWVEDTGTGMDPGILDQLSPLSKAALRPGTDGERGSGFGLVLVRELVAGWGGTLTFDSAPGRGTRVRIGFPRD